MGARPTSSAHVLIMNKLIINNEVFYMSFPFPLFVVILLYLVELYSGVKVAAEFAML